MKENKPIINQQNTAEAVPDGGNRKKPKKRRGHLVDLILVLAVMIGAGLLVYPTVAGDRRLCRAGFGHVGGEQQLDVGGSADIQ